MGFWPEQRENQTVNRAVRMQRQVRKAAYFCPWGAASCGTLATHLPRSSTRDAATAPVQYIRVGHADDRLYLPPDIMAVLFRLHMQVLIFSAPA